MEQQRAILRARAEAALRRRVRRAVYAAVAPVAVEAHHVHGEPIPEAHARAAAFEPFRVGDPWGAAWETTWFRLRGRVPREWAGFEVVARVGLGYHGMPGFGAEGLVWIDGRPVQGVNVSHPTVRLFGKAEGGEPLEVLVEAAANPLAVIGRDPAPLLAPDFGGAPLFVLDRADIAAVDADAAALFMDLTVLLDLYDHLPAGDRRSADVLRALSTACDILDDAEDVSAVAAAARQPLLEVLGRPAAASAHRFSAVGNAHIDTAWLWPLRETARKCARTFSTALALMEDHPDYVFAVSQTQQLEWMRDRYPQLWDRMVQRVREGRIEPVGCMWVEPDCNVPSGESLVRQIVHGMRFLREELDCEPTEVWLPDVFGYSAALPQIMRLAGVRRFLTQKLSWNQFNRMPHHTFWWEGIDGSRVLAHFPPADTYNGTMQLGELQHAVGSFADHDVASGSLYLFGYGDGGGGPTSEMLERAHRLRDLEGAPRVELERVGDFWERAESESAAMAVWAGELYFEFHRGTYTTHADVKRNNRQLELLLREAELWSSVRDDPWAYYPAAALDRAWKDLLTLQFHDILPGTSIHRVYEEAAETYGDIRTVAGDAATDAAAAIAGEVDTTGTERPVVLFNAAPVARDEVVVVEAPDDVSVAVPPDGANPATVQQLGEGKVAFAARVPALGYARYDLRKDGWSGHAGVVDAGDGWATNGILRVEWDAEGTLTRVRDIEAEREVLAPGERGNVLQLLDDRPNQWDAWDIDFFAHEPADVPAVPATVEVVERGPLRAAVRFSRPLGARSTLGQTMLLTAGSRRIDFVTEVDWHEDHKLLKVAFPVDIHARRATFEIQYGHVERPTHRNTSWDIARFEVCAHKWADLSEPGYGVALLNDCKYGYDVLGNVLRLSLLRAPTSPDPQADRGHHRFTYALLPHPGDLREAGVIDEGYRLNVPVRAVAVEPDRPGRRPAHWAGVEVSEENVLVEVVKRAETQDAMVLRLYESWGRRGPVRIRLPEGAAHVTRVDLLERGGEPVERDADGRAVLHVRPFEIVTLLATT